MVGWRDETCFACEGTGVEPEPEVQCLTCRGRGGWARHVGSGLLAAYPGGPIVAGSRPQPGR